MIIQLQESLNLERSKHVSLTILIHIMYIGQLMQIERGDYLKLPRPAQSKENEVEEYLPAGESNIPENTFPLENNSKDPTVKNPAQPTERTSIKIPHEQIPEYPLRIT
jgi:hypothetical protein